MLDLESCCIGEPSYDIVYLYTQQTTSTLSDYPAVRNHLDLDQVQIDSLESLALISVLSWSIERLLNITLGRVEHYLVDTGIQERILKYVNNKSARLNELLNAL